MNEIAEMIRLRYKYRRLIIEGAIRLPLRAAAPLVGPDCAYHLYAYQGHDPHEEACQPAPDAGHSSVPPPLKRNPES